MCYSENKNLPLLIPKFAKEEKEKKKQDKEKKKQDKESKENKPE